MLCRVLGPDAELHLIDPFLDASGWALPPDARPIEGATRRAVARATRRGGPDGRGGPRVHWQIARSQDAGRTWTGGAVDLVFIDGDHSPEGCREDFEVWSPHVGAQGAIAFHDAREGLTGGRGSIGPTSVVDALFRSGGSQADVVADHRRGRFARRGRLGADGHRAPAGATGDRS